MARLLVVVNSVILLLFGSDVFLVGASEYQPPWPREKNADLRVYI